MAKQSWKQQMYEQIANSQVQQVMQQQREQGIAQLQAEYDAWQKQQNDIAQLQAEYDNWYAQNNPQPVQPVQTAPVQTVKKAAPNQESIPSLADFFRPTTASGRDLNKEAANRQQREDYQRQQQLEQMEAEGNRPTYGNGLNTGIKQLDLSAIQNEMNKAASQQKEQQNEDLERQILNADRYVVDNAPQLTDEQKALEEQIANFDEYQVNKSDPEKGKKKLAAFGWGVSKIPFLASELIANGLVDAGESLGQAGAVALDDLTGHHDDHQNLEKVNDYWNAKRDQVADNIQWVHDSQRQSEEENPLAYGAGKFATQAALYAVTNPLFDKVGSVAGAGAGKLASALGASGKTANVAAKAASIAGNQIGQNLQDVALDTIPRYNELKALGMSDDVIKDTLVKEGLINAGGNAFFGAVSELPGLVKKLGNKPMPQLEDVDNVVRNATRQAEEATQNIENIAKQMPEIPENVPTRPGTAAPVIENEAEAIAKAMDAEAKAIEPPKAIEAPKTPEIVEPETPKLLSDDVEAQLAYDFENLGDSYYGNRAAIKESLESKDFSIPNTAINDVPGKNGKMQYEIIDLDNNRKIKTYASRKAAEKAQADYAAGNVLKEKAIKAFDDLDGAIFRYEKAAYNSADVEEVNTAKKAVEAARKRYERAMKEYDPSYYDAVASKDFGDRIARPYYTRNPAAENPVDDALIDDMVKDWVDHDINNPNRFVKDAVPDSTNVYRGASNVPGAEPLQTFADGSKKGDWKTSKAYKTFERMGYGDALKEEDFAYRVFHEDEQRALAAERYKDSKNIAQDLLDRDYAEFDEADIKAIYPEMEALHNNGDRDSLRTLDRLAKKSASVERESGRILQAKQEFSNTIGAALQDAHKAQDDFILDPWRSKNKKAREGNSRIAKALADMGHKNIPTEKPVLDHEQIKSGIIAELKKEFGSIDSYFNDEDIEFLTNLAEDRSIPLWQITDEIEHKLNHGTFYPIEKEVVEKFEGNSRLANILKSMGDKTTPETKAPLSHDEIKKGITNELKREFADMEAQFTDSDIEFLTRLVEDKSVKNWQIADEISHKLEHGTWYSLDESLPENTIKNTQISNILDNMYKDKKIAKPKKEMTIGELLTGIKNSFEADPISSSKNFTDDDYYFVAQMVQNNVPRWQIEDEILHRIENGKWYTLDESIAEKPVKNKQVSNMLDNIINGKKAAKPKKEMTIGELLTGIKNSFEDEPISTAKKFTDDDYYFIAQMMQENVPRWKMEDELAHRIQHGEWYALDESLPVKQPTNRKLQNALNSLVEETVRTENAAPSLKQIAEEVRNTLSKESADFDGLFTDDDIDYLANLIHEGVTKQELTDALDMKLATGSFGISDETLQEVNNIFKQISNYDPNSKQFVEGQAEAYRLLANEILPNATLKEKFEAWRYIAMLGNPKTMLRNYIGNQTFNVVTGISNSVAAVAEEGVDRAVKALGGEGIQRTKAVLNPKTDSGLIKACAEDADASRYRQIIGSKYEKMSKDTLRRSKSVFNSKLAQLYEKVTDAGISDYSAVKKKYSTSLAGYMKANGMSTDIFKAEDELRNLKNLGETRLLSDAEQARVATLSNQVQELEKARDYALKQAEYATFHEDNKIADVLSKWSKTSKEEGTGIGHILLEGMVPFKKTPANVLRSGLEYSPLGAIKSIKKTGKLVYENTGKRAGNLADVYKNKAGKDVARTLASDVIDSWAKTLTGTGLTALGFYLYNKGILHSSDPDTKYQDELEGHQNYAIEINGKSYTIDWAAPTVMPLMVGAEIAKLWDSTGKGDENFYDNIDGYVEAANRIADPLIETSMLQGVRDTLETAATYAQNNEAMNILPLLAYNTATGYATQGIPTLGGQIARTIDPTRRSTYTDQEGVAGVLDRQVKKQMNKIPGASMLNQPYVDTYGREQQNGPFNNPLARLGYQMFSPGYLTNINETDADRISREAYEVGNVANTLPKWQSKFKDASGNRVSPEDYTTASKAYGQANYEIRDALANDDWFNSLEDTQKEEIVKGINTIAEHVGNAAIDPNYTKDSKAYNAYKDGGIPGLLDYYKGETAKDTAKDLLGDSGVTTNSNAGKAVAEAVKNGDMAQAEQLAEQAKAEKAEKVKTEETKEDLSSYGLTSISPAKTYEKAQTIIPGLTTEKFATTYKKIDADGNQGIKQDEVISYLNSQKITSESEAKKIWSAYGNSTWKSIPKLENGKWVKKKK